MGDISKEIEEERRLREAAVTRALGQPPPAEETEPAEAAAGKPDREVDAEDDASRARHDQQHLWVDHQIRQAMARGEFDNLPGAGKPLKLPDRHDPDWWVKQLIEREKLTGVLPPALALRKDDAELEAELDRQATEAEVRRTVEDFNRRVIEARRQLQGGPPVVTSPRDVEAEVAAWHERRTVRRTRAAAAQQADRPHAGSPPRRHRWWRRRHAR